MEPPITRSHARGGVAQLVRALPCHGRGRGFESRRSRFWRPPPNARATTMKKATRTMNAGKSGSKEGDEGDSPSELIDQRIEELSDWRGETLARVRALV